MLFLAIASQRDGDAVYGTLHDTYQAAEDAARIMCVELQERMGWDVFPHVMDLEYVQSNQEVTVECLSAPEQ
jgi:hypothetical protein